MQAKLLHLSKSKWICQFEYNQSIFDNSSQVIAENGTAFWMKFLFSAQTDIGRYIAVA